MLKKWVLEKYKYSKVLLKQELGYCIQSKTRKLVEYIK